MRPGRMGVSVGFHPCKAVENIAPSEHVRQG